MNAVRLRHRAGLAHSVGTLALNSLFAVFLASASDYSTTSKPLDEMSLEDLVKVQVSVGTLGGSELRKVPASITTITSEDIRESGARNLDELLEIYVPDLLYLRHNWEGDHLGFRGIIGDEDNKFLLLVNGKVMNNLVHAGSLSERDINLLGDIKEIQVVRGPGSAVYGAGALIGVIDIKTFDGESFQGTEVTGRAGELEEYYSAEIKSGIKLSDNAHLFLYAGFADLEGADRNNAPLILGVSGRAFNGTPIVAGQSYPLPLSEDKQEFHGFPSVKLHAQLTVGDFSLWTRYTSGGEVQGLEQRWLIQYPYGFAASNTPPNSYMQQGVGYQQISVGSDYKHAISDQWEIGGRLSYDMDDYVRRATTALIDANREDLYTGRLLATWNSSSVHSLTFGMEYLHGEFGLPPFGYPGGPALSTAWASIHPTTPDQLTGFMPRWSSDTYSFLSEDRWDITPKLSLFTDLRIDKNDQTDYMFSPRVAAIWTPTRNDTFKLILSQATKSDVAETLELERELSGAKDDTETLRAVELSYNRLQGDHLSFGASTFFNDFDLIGWDDVNNRTQPIGDADIVGVELEASYRTRQFQVGFSHSYSKLVAFRNSVGGIEGQAITSQPYGFGHDLNQWSSHITKLYFTYRPVDRLRFTGSLRVFWGWPGYQDYTAYAESIKFDSSGDPLEFRRDPSYNPYGDIQARLNLGVIYDINRHLTAAVHGYNLLGLVDGSLNNRFIMFSSSAQRDAAAVVFTLSCKF